MYPCLYCWRWLCTWAQDKDADRIARTLSDDQILAPLRYLAHAVCLFGPGRTTADTLIRRACRVYGLGVWPEPEGLNLFSRSDNYSLAWYGIPAPNFSLGMTDWDEEVEKRYHRLSDEVGNMDLNYVVRFVRAYILSAEYIADAGVQPRWTKGDMYEKDWEVLFGKK